MFVLEVAAGVALGIWLAPFLPALFGLALRILALIAALLTGGALLSKCGPGALFGLLAIGWANLCRNAYRDGARFFALAGSFLVVYFCWAAIFPYGTSGRPATVPAPLSGPSPMQIPPRVLDAYESGRMTPVDRMAMEDAVASGVYCVPEGFKLGKTDVR